jgi:hypothetical protein
VIRQVYLGSQRIVSKLNQVTRGHANEYRTEKALLSRQGRRL